MDQSLKLMEALAKSQNTLANVTAAALSLRNKVMGHDRKESLKACDTLFHVLQNAEDVLQSTAKQLQKPAEPQCSNVLDRNGFPFPRTCGVCGLGPCSFNTDTTDFPTKPCRKCGKTDRPQFEGICNDDHCGEF